jgi:hypothetical protein
MNKYLLHWMEPEQIGPDDWYEHKCYRLCDNKHHMMNKIVSLFKSGIINVIVNEVDANFDLRNIQ